jgi:hypothetical protein
LTLAALTKEIFLLELSLCQTWLGFQIQQFGWLRKLFSGLPRATTEWVKRLPEPVLLGLLAIASFFYIVVLYNKVNTE